MQRLRCLLLRRVNDGKTSRLQRSYLQPCSSCTANITSTLTLYLWVLQVLKCPYKSKPEENKEKEHLHYSNTVDSWAVGVLVYELLVGCPPFYDKSKSNTEARIVNGMPHFPPTISEAAKDFICAGKHYTLVLLKLVPPCLTSVAAVTSLAIPQGLRQAQSSSCSMPLAW